MNKNLELNLLKNEAIKKANKLHIEMVIKIEKTLSTQSIKEKIKLLDEMLKG